ncbi:MAG TPA: phosphoglycerate kinase [Candidatus Nanoarchaeia archaeon]|nr:phosphoglycerate kinase [Candidatus Nanoarchaeia archaeon]
MVLRTLKAADLEGKRVLVRVDFNVPLDKGNVMNDKRIREALPTINLILEKGASQVLLITHIGRPEGEIVESLKTDSVAQRLAQLMKQDVVKLDDCIGLDVPEHEKIIMLENVRFYKAEEANNEGFAQGLSRCADVFVNDAFGTSHRKHASVHAITKFLPSYAGLLLEKEVNMLSALLVNPKKPFIALIGGVKIDTKIAVLENLAGKVDKMLIGGGMAFTFLKAQGFETGTSIVQDSEIKIARRIMDGAGDKLILPVDIIAAEKAEAGISSKAMNISSFPKNLKGLDIGPETVEYFCQEIQKAKTIFWNGTMGINEIEDFAKGSRLIAEAMAAMQGSAITVIGGGDTVGFIERLGLQDKITHVSTGGGAALEFLEGKTLPAVAVLEED